MKHPADGSLQQQRRRRIRRHRRIATTSEKHAQRIDRLHADENEATKKNSAACCMPKATRIAMECDKFRSILLTCCSPKNDTQTTGVSTRKVGTPQRINNTPNCRSQCRAMTARIPAMMPQRETIPRSQERDLQFCNALTCLQLATHRASSDGTHRVVTQSGSFTKDTLLSVSD